MYKKIYIFLMLFIIGFQNIAYAGKEPSKTDIKAYIDYTPVRSYNIDSYTYIVAEELINYGFDVLWDGNSRILNIVRKKFCTPVYTKELYEYEEEQNLTIYNTDIKVYLNDREIKSFNIGGKTIVLMDEFLSCADVVWDEANREISILAYEYELEEAFNSVKNKEKIISENMKYEGEVDSGGIPSGVGRMNTVETVASAGVGYVKTEEMLGYFKNGIPCGNVSMCRCITAGKTGELVYSKFIGKVQEKENTTENFGKLIIPYYKTIDYMGHDVFGEKYEYKNGIWIEDNQYRGQSGVIFKSWYDGIYQSVLKLPESELTEY